MGNVVAFNITLEMPFFQPEPSHPWLPLAIVAILSFIGLFLFFFFRRSSKRQPNPNPTLPFHTRARRAIPWITVAICLSLLLISSSEAHPLPKNRPKPLRYAKKAGKAAASSAAAIIASTGAYFGLEALTEWILESPDLTVVFLAVIGCFFTLLILLILKAASLIYHYFHKTDTPQHLLELQSLSEEILQRTRPPNVPTAHPSH